jgi:hypothetical protein
LRFEPFDRKRYDRSRFDCGVAALNQYLRIILGGDAAGLCRDTHNRRQPSYPLVLEIQPGQHDPALGTAGRAAD